MKDNSLTVIETDGFLWYHLGCQLMSIQVRGGNSKFVNLCIQIFLINKRNTIFTVFYYLINPYSFFLYDIK